jgi:hypothetical protein
MERFLEKVLDLLTRAKSNYSCDSRTKGVGMKIFEKASPDP